jgi:hypothetical protein
MTNIWGVVSHLMALGIGAFVAGAFLWFFPNRKDLKASLTAKREAKIDARVLSAIGNRELWTGPRGMTGAG